MGEANTNGGNGNGGRVESLIDGKFARLASKMMITIIAGAVSFIGMVLVPQGMDLLRSMSSQIQRSAAAIELLAQKVDDGNQLRDQRFMEHDRMLTNHEQRIRTIETARRP